MLDFQLFSVVVVKRRRDVWAIYIFKYIFLYRYVFFFWSNICILLSYVTDSIYNADRPLCPLWFLLILTEFGLLTEMPWFLMAGASEQNIVFFMVLFFLCLCFSCVCFVAIILQPLTISYNVLICLASNLSLNNVDKSMNHYFLKLIIKKV